MPDTVSNTNETHNRVIAYCIMTWTKLTSILPIFRLYDKIRMMGGRKGAIILIFRMMAGGLNFKADPNRMRTVL